MKLTCVSAHRNT